MSRVSIIIPSRHETFEVSPGMSILQKTVEDIYKKARGDIEVIVAFDGEPYQDFPDYPKLTRLHLPWRGTKEAINSAVSVAKGEYILKTDSHCMFSDGFDEVLQEHMQDSWVVMPRMYILDAERWRWQDGRFYDYFYLPCPFIDRKGFRFQAGGHWKERTSARIYKTIDENMKLHGSCWFMNRDFYLDKLGGLDPNNGAGSWNGEDIEITMKTWLGPWDGKLMVNKNCWFAHMHRGKQRPREFRYSESECNRSANWTAEYWMNNSWAGQAHKIEWLIDKFWPIPGWPENWKDLLEEWRGD